MDFQSAKSFGKLRLRAFQPYHQILCILNMSKMSKIDQIHIRAVMLCMSKMSKKNIHTHFAHNFLNIQWIFNPQKVLRKTQLFNHTSILCMSSMSKHVEDSNTITYVCRRWEKKYTHILLITFLIFNDFQSAKSFES